MPLSAGPLSEKEVVVPPGFLSAVFWISKASRREKKREGGVFTCFYTKIEFAFYRACVFRQITGFSQWFLIELSTRIHCSWLSRGEVRKIPMPSHPELPSVIHKFYNSTSFCFFFLIQKIKSKCTIMFISCISIIVFVLKIFFKVPVLCEN